MFCARMHILRPHWSGTPSSPLHFRCDEVKVLDFRSEWGYCPAMTFQSTESCATGHWSGNFDDADLQQWATQLRSHLRAPEVSLGLVFMAPWLAPHAASARNPPRPCPSQLAGGMCSGASLIAGSEEIEQHPGLVAGLYHLPGGGCAGVSVHSGGCRSRGGPAYWHSQAGLEPADVHGWLVFMDPYTVDGERWLGQW